MIFVRKCFSSSNHFYLFFRKLIWINISGLHYLFILIIYVCSQLHNYFSKYYVNRFIFFIFDLYLFTWIYFLAFLFCNLFILSFILMMGFP